MSEGIVQPTPEEAALLLADYRERLSADWERCQHWIAAALKHDGGFYTIEYIKDLVFEQGSGVHFWAGKRSAAITQWWFFPNDKVLNLWLAGGNLRELVELMFPAAEQWARDRGATRIMLAGRKGWERVFAPKGFSMLSTVLVKDLREQ